MKKEYFNRIEFLRALSLFEGHPVDALREFEKYIENYPHDYNSYSYYISLLIMFGRADEASKLIDEVSMVASGNNAFKWGAFKYGVFKQHILYSKLKLLAYLGKYKEFYKLYINNYDSLKMNNINLEHVSFYFRKKMGLHVKLKENNSEGYMYNQMYNYNEKLFLEHIKKHMVDYDKNDECNTNVFALDFPILKIVEEIKKFIPSENGLFTGFMEDVYVFKYDSCGRDNNRLVDYFKVVCFHNTQDFITMCPVYGYEGYPYIDLNYLKENNDEKIRRKSRIDRFNSRYSK